MLVAVLAGGYCIWNIAGDTIITNWLGSRCLLIGTQDKIDWTEEPRLSGDYLIMSGQTKDSARIHDARSEYGDTVHPAFTLVETLTNGQEPTIVTVAEIWPVSMSWLIGGADTTALFGEAGGYDVSASEFYVKTRLPVDIKRPLHGDANLAVVVWEKEPQSASAALGAKCIKENTW